MKITFTDENHNTILVFKNQKQDDWSHVNYARRGRSTFQRVYWDDDEMTFQRITVHNIEDL